MLDVIRAVVVVGFVVTLFTWSHALAQKRDLRGFAPGITLSDAQKMLETQCVTKIGNPIFSCGLKDRTNLHLFATDMGQVWGVLFQFKSEAAREEVFAKIRSEFAPLGANCSADRHSECYWLNDRIQLRFGEGVIDYWTSLYDEQLRAEWKEGEENKKKGI